jgi:sn-glycerol 3-phosphate transport system substrate-binding protein
MSTFVVALGALAATACNGEDALDAVSPTGTTPAPTESTPTVPSDGDAGSTTAAGSASPSGPVPTDAPGDGTDPSRCDPAAALAGPTTITFWSALDRLGGAAIDGLVERFTAEHPGITVDVVEISGYFAIIEALRDTPPEDSPDLVMGSVNDLQRLRDSDRFLVPSTCAPSLTSQDDLVPVVAATYESGGDLVAVPFNVSTPVLLYDRARFAAAGLDPDDPPATPDEVRAALEAMEMADPTVDGLVFYDRAASWLLDQWSAQDGRLLLEPGNAIDVDVADIAVDTAENRASLAWAQALVADGLAMTVGTNTSGIDDLVKMIDPAAPGAMAFHTSAALGDVMAFRDALPADDRWDIGVGPLPGPGVGSLVGGAALWLADRGAGADPMRAGAAWVLADWLLQAEQQAELAAATGYVPAVTAAVDEPVLRERWAAEPILEVGFRQLAAMPATPATVGIRVGPRVDVERALELAAAAALGGVDPATELARAELEIAAILDRYTG